MLRKDKYLNIFIILYIFKTYKVITITLVNSNNLLFLLFTRHAVVINAQKKYILFKL